MKTEFNPGDKIYLAGHRGLVGSAILRNLKSKGFNRIVTRSHSDLDLTNQNSVRSLFESEQFDHVILAAAKVGGIAANAAFQADFLYENMMIAANVIHAAHDVRVKKCLFLGSSCIYPKLAPQPIREDSLLTGPLEPTNEGYAIAKIAGLKLCQHYNQQYGDCFISAMPTNLYGPFDNFHPTHSHVVPGMMRRFHEAKQREDKVVNVWGSGKPRRELLYVDDLAEAIFLLMNQYEDDRTINVGTGEDCTIAHLAETVKKTVGFKGNLEFDTSRPDGTPKKQLDTNRIQSLGWRPRVTLEEGLKRTYEWAVKNGVFDSE